VGPSRDDGVIQLRVPAQPDLVSVLRVAARVVAGRAGTSDDARTRLQAAVGRTFFALLEGWSDAQVVTMRLRPAPDRVIVELTADGQGQPSGLASLVAREDLGDGRELASRGRVVRLWVDR